jgi:hypothetical protein
MCDYSNSGHRRVRYRAYQKPRHRGRTQGPIALPNGFEYKEAEMGNTLFCRVSAGDKLTFELKNTYAQLNAFDWNN